LVACIRFKKFIKFCEKFEKVLNKFEFKSLVLFVFEKKEKKREPHLPFGPAGLPAHLLPPAAAHLFTLPFLFP
jgi:hypothetical protein